MIICIMFLVGFLSICAHRINAQIVERRASLAAIARYHQYTAETGQQGIDPEGITSFPIVKYSDVKDIQIGKGILECTICLTEFSDEDRVRLLPECDHVYHPLCIDKWLASHATCPVCRTNLLQPPQSNNDSLSTPINSSGLSNYHVSIQIDDHDRRSTANLIAFDAEKERRYQISIDEIAVAPPIRRSLSAGSFDGLDYMNEQMRRNPLQRDGSGVVFGSGEECSRMTYRDPRESQSR